MRLNPDCIRDILLTVEALPNLHTSLYVTEDNYKEHERFCEYSFDEITYHANQCKCSGLLTECNVYINDTFEIFDLSPAGHEFLANIRTDTIWKDVKKIANNIGSKSLSAILQIASSVISEIIKSQLRASGTII